MYTVQTTEGTLRNIFITFCVKLAPPARIFQRDFQKNAIFQTAMPEAFDVFRGKCAAISELFSVAEQCFFVYWNKNAFERKKDNNYYISMYTDSMCIVYTATETIVYKTNFLQKKKCKSAVLLKMCYDSIPIKNWKTKELKNKFKVCSQVYRINY